MKKYIKNIIFLFFIMAFFFFPFQPLTAEENTISLSDAILQTLDINPRVKIEKNRLEQKEGRLQTASGQFDWMVKGTISHEERDKKATIDDMRKYINDYLNQPYSDTETDEATFYSLGLTKQFRNGITISPTVSALDSAHYDDFRLNIDPINRSEYRVDIVIPLMKGLGKNNTGAEEIAAKHDLRSTQFLSTQNTSQRIFETANSYWNCLAARQNFKILEDSLNRINEIHKLIERLVKSGEIEPAVIHETRAKAYGTEATLDDSRLNVYTSRQALAFSIGFTSKELTPAPLAEGPFPAVINPGIIDQELAARYIDQAMDHRGDYLAAQVNIDIEETLLQKAKNNLKPDLDFNFRLNYTGLSEMDDSDRYYRSFSDNIEGPNVFGSLTLKWPIINDAARGNFISRKSQTKIAKLATEELSNKIAFEVRVAIEELRTAAHEYQLAKQSTEDYRETVKHSNYKFKIGQSNLFSLIGTEDQYSRARIREINALRRYAVALAKLRFYTGTLLTKEDNNLRFRVDWLMTPPLLH